MPGTRALRDISILLQPGTPEWPGDTPFDCHWAWRIAQGASVNVSCIAGSPHVGTHADAPLHVRDGAAGSDALPLEPFMGPAHVVDLRERVGPIDPADLGIGDLRIERLLLRTGATIAGGAFPDSWPWLTPACIAELLTRGLRLLGVDAPSVDARDSKTLDAHHALFDGGAFILENLDLRGVEAGSWDLVSLPLRLHGLDAAPVRALLRPLVQ